jgi:23S rRNA (adenine2503-C2)-methyltransferase
MKKNLKAFSREELLHFVKEHGEKPFRAGQLWSWIYQKGVTSFDEMTNISKEFRKHLDSVAYISSLKLVEDSRSKTSDTRKFLWELEDGLKMESVYIPDGKRRTVCISTQIGCLLGCAFCATGSMGFIRNLYPYEIVDQILCVQRLVEEKPSNIVVMGMGEPFLNYFNVIKALFIIKDPEGISIGHRKITISTAGILPKLKQYIEEKQPFQLAISLNATTETQRSQIMPISKKYPLRDLLNIAKEYTKRSKKRLTFEYVLMKDVNDSPEDARRLIRILRNIPCKVNLIAYNPTNNRFARPDDERIQAFASSIRKICSPITLRLSRGDDIQGACGQLFVPTRKGDINRANKQE